MDIDIIRTRELTIVHCRGRLVFAGGADLLHTAAAQAFLAGQDVALDLRRVTQVDAHGAGVLADLFRLARQAGRALSMTGATDRVRRVLRVTGLESLVQDAEEPGTPGRTRAVPRTPWPSVAGDRRCRTAPHVQGADNPQDGMPRTRLRREVPGQPEPA